MSDRRYGATGARRSRNARNRSPLEHKDELWRIARDPDNVAPMIDDQIYEEAAASYASHSESSAYNAGYERPAVQALAASCGLEGKHVLDAGCGAGPNADWLALQGARVTAIDKSEPLLALARKRLAHWGDKVTVHRADLSKPLEFLRHGSVDLVMSSLTLHYVEDWSVPLREFHRVLTAAGQLVFSTHHPLTTWTAFHRDDYFRTGLVVDTWTLNGSERQDVRYFTRTLSGIFSAVTAAGFVVEDLIEPEPDEDIGRAVCEQIRTSPPFLLVRARARGAPASQPR
jgi:ubiquinone/menaquinone biosynthesis C-methylase UbiE